MVPWSRVPSEDRRLLRFDGQRPDVAEMGYIASCCLHGHLHCQCLRSQSVLWWKPHDPATGPWPVNYRVDVVYEWELQDIIGTTWSITVSYGYKLL